MISLILQQPETVEINGVSYGIITDYREWLRFISMWEDEELSDDNKVIFMSQYLFCMDEDGNSDDTQHVLFTEEFIDAVLWFLTCGMEQKLSGTSTKDVPREQLLDYTLDAPLIYAAFRQAYGIDLFEIEFLHWWAFRALIDGLPEATYLSKVISIRATDLSKIPKSQRTDYAKLKKRVAVAAKKNKVNHIGPPTLEERDAQLKSRAANIQKRIAEASNKGGE